MIMRACLSEMANGDSLLSTSPARSPSLFSCRIVDIDYSMVPPIKGLDVTYSEFSGSPVRKVPVIRIFGSTPAGQKCCVHVHGAFPYLYVPCLTDNPSDKYTTQLGQSIDHGLKVSLSSSSSDDKHVFKINMVTGIPFYGYHSSEKLFAKIYLYNPAHIKRVSDLLLSGAIMNNIFQPHESHIPYPLQFMIDYNLYGMNFIHTSAVHFRIRGDLVESGVPQRDSTPPFLPQGPSSPRMSLLSSSSSSVSSIFLQPTQHIWKVEKLPDNMLVMEARVSSCELEADVLAADILNREEVDMSSGGFPGLAALWEEEQLRRDNLGIDTPLSQPASPDRTCNLIHSAEERFKAQLEEIVESRTSSLLPALDTPPPFQSSSLFPLSQSCDLEVHDPTESSIHLGEVEYQGEDHSNAIVDEEVIFKQREMTKKLSNATVDTSDTELLNILTELAGPSSQLHPLPSSSSLSSSQSVLSQALSSRLSATARSISSDSSGSRGTNKPQTKPTTFDKHDYKCHSPLGSEMDLFDEPIVNKALDECEREQRSPSSFSASNTSHLSFLEDTIPCNQYAEGGVLHDEKNRVIKGVESTDATADPNWLDQSHRSPTPDIQDESVIQPSQPLSSQSLLRQLSLREKQELIRLCSDLSRMDEEEERGERNALDEPTDEPEGEYEDNEEQESMLMSRVVWSEDDDAGNMEEQNRETELELDQENDIIPQLDGPGDQNNHKRKGRLSLKRKPRERGKAKSSPELSTKAKTEMVKAQSIVPSSSKSQRQTPPLFADTHTQTFTKEGTPTVEEEDQSLCKPDIEEATARPLDTRSHLVRRALSGALEPAVIVTKLSKKDIEKFKHQSVVGTSSETRKDTCEPEHVKAGEGAGVAISDSSTSQRDVSMDQESTATVSRKRKASSLGRSSKKKRAPHHDVVLQSSTHDKGRNVQYLETALSEDQLIELAKAESLLTCPPEVVMEVEKRDRMWKATTTSLVMGANNEEMGDDSSEGTKMESSETTAAADNLPVIVSRSDKGSLLLLDRTVVESGEEEEGELGHTPVRLLDQDKRQEGQGEDEFKLVFSTSETEGSESEVGGSQTSVSSPPAAATVSCTVHFWSKKNDDEPPCITEDALKSTSDCDEAIAISQQSSVPFQCSDITSNQSYVITPSIAPPSAEEVMETLSSSQSNLPSVRHLKPFYSNPKDVQPPRDFGGKLFWVPSLMPYDLKEFSPPCLEEHPKDIYFTLNHWRTVLTMINAPIGHSQVKGPPNCYPDVRNGKSRHLFYTAADYERDMKIRSTFVPNCSCVITPNIDPPSQAEVKQWVKDHSEVGFELDLKGRIPSESSSLLEGPSLDNTYGFKVTPENNNQSLDSNVQYVTSMSIEIHVRTRLGLKPDPEWDPVLVLCYSIHNDWEPESLKAGLIVIDLNQCKDLGTPVKQKKKSPVKKSPAKSKASPRKAQHRTTTSSRLAPTIPAKNFTAQFIGSHSSINPPNYDTLSLDDDKTRPYLDHCGISTDIIITYVQSESDLFDEFIKLVRQVDPDFLVGYELQMSSLGYLRDRAAYLGINLIGQLGRVPALSQGMVPPTATSPSRQYQEIHVVGRLVLNLWKILKHEVSLMSYSFENVCFHALHKRVPKFSHQTLTEWYDFANRLYRYRVIEYYMIRCHGNHELIDKFNLIGRTSEMARLYGIEFHNVLSRGSQYRVESMMLRLAKPANYIAISPSVYQRARMAAPECLPLILEPESKFYSDPVLVLDFQSLYPSMVIGYNYCFSTCLGRVSHLAVDGDYTIGTCSMSISASELEKIKDNVTISPNGIVFVKPNVRDGILPRMLREILNTRIMVKQSMKLHKNNKTLLKMLDARQLSLKLIANVTYGYTGATFSGRMPCVEVADSIVRKGRETLERAIHMINSTQKWKARVVYGDTDSVFVLLKGVSKDEAFRIGHEMCQSVTRDNPKPVKLKFEKVYLPCILQTKKRYVGYSYESPNQKDPVYDAKGIETVRRDGCPAVGKILEKCLRLLFSSCDLSLVKSYLQRQCLKIMKGQVSLQDFTFAKEYRGHGGYRPGACVPALELSRQSLSVDPRSEPRVGERVPYVVVYGSPGLPLIELVRRPEEFLTDSSLRLNSVYYITKQILPALDRGFALMGVDVFQWYNELPKIKRHSLPPPRPSSHRSTIGQYFTSMHCLICRELTTESICKQCRKDPHSVTAVLSSRIHKAQKKYHTLSQLCGNCCGYSDSHYYLECVSLDCPVLYVRQTSLNQLQAESETEVAMNQFCTSL